MIIVHFFLYLVLFACVYAFIYVIKKARRDIAALRAESRRAAQARKQLEAESPWKVKQANKLTATCSKSLRDISASSTRWNTLLHSEGTRGLLRDHLVHRFLLKEKQEPLLLVDVDDGDDGDDGDDDELNERVCRVVTGYTQALSRVSGRSSMESRLALLSICCLDDGIMLPPDTTLSQLKALSRK